MKVSSIALLCMLSSLCVEVIQAAPTTVTLTAVKDCNVVKAAPNTAFPSDPNLSAHKADGTNQQFFLWEFRLPDDCIAQNIDPATFKFKMVMLKKRITTQREFYVNIIKNGTEINIDDLNALTFNTAPGVLKDLTTLTTSNNIDTVTAGYIGYCPVTQSDGEPWEYVPALDANANYLAALITHLNDDTNQRFIFLYHPRYINTIGDYWASTENTQYPGPQIEFTYEPTKVAIEKSGDYLNVTEGGATDTYNLYLTSQPASEVTVTLGYNAERLLLSPTSVVFTPSNYNVPQTVTIAAVEDNIANADEKIMISHAVLSADTEFDGSGVGNVYVKVIDNDSVTASLTAVKDSTVKRLSSGTSFASGDLMLKKLNSTPDIDIQVSYVQFELPQDFEYAVDAKFSIVQTSLPAAGNISKIYLIGINDDIAQADADSFNWLNAPALDKRARAIDGLNCYDNEQAVYLAGIDIAISGSQGAVLTTSPAEGRVIAQWLSRDTDKQATIMIVRQKSGDFTDSFASVENGTYAAPVLDISYGTAAHSYCQQPGRIYDPEDFNNDCIVNFEDFAAFAEDWMQQ